MRWCATEAGLPAARQDARDELVGAMGEHHGGHVTWVELTGLYALTALALAAAADDAGHGSQELRGRYRRLRARLQDRGGWLVIATAPGLR
jgi:hypothetical protein